MVLSMKTEEQALMVASRQDLDKISDMQVCPVHGEMQVTLV